MIHFWATWCEPCREELKELKTFMAQLPQLRVVQISVDFRWDEVDQFLKKLGLERKGYDYLDPGGKTSRALGTTKYPETYLVDPTGVAVAKYVGPQKWNSPEATRFFSLLSKFKSADDLERAMKKQ